MLLMTSKFYVTAVKHNQPNWSGNQPNLRPKNYRYLAPHVFVAIYSSKN